MSGSAEFLKAMGEPSPAAPPGLHFTEPGIEFVWETFHEVIGAGWYQNRFWYLFGEGLDRLSPCLAAWSFLVPPGPERMILGRNAYGALLVLENPNALGSTSRVHILNPLDVV